MANILLIGRMLLESPTSPQAWRKSALAFLFTGLSRVWLAGEHFFHASAKKGGLGRLFPVYQLILHPRLKSRARPSKIQQMDLGMCEQLESMHLGIVFRSGGF